MGSGLDVMGIGESRKRLGDLERVGDWGYLVCSVYSVCLVSPLREMRNVVT